MYTAWRCLLLTTTLTPFAVTGNSLHTPNRTSSLTAINALAIASNRASAPIRTPVSLDEMSEEFLSSQQSIDPTFNLDTFRKASPVQSSSDVTPHNNSSTEQEQKEEDRNDQTEERSK
jgi:hypothetical protein